MIHILHWLLFIMTVSKTTGLLCYNCSSSHYNFNPCGGDFVAGVHNVFNSSRHFLVNCTGEDAMCFVRSWSTRAKHAWIVQRGCYQPTKNDPLPRAVHVPTRAMSCKYERLPEAEYKICLCQADWCNSATPMSCFSILKTMYVYAVLYIIRKFHNPTQCLFI